MHKIEVKDWRMFEQEIEKLCGTEKSGKKPRFLFRGVGHSEWDRNY